MVADRGFTKSWSFKSLVAAVVVAGVLALAPSAQTQELPTAAPTTNDCSPNPATSGETIICTTTVTNPFEEDSDFALIGAGLDIGTTGATIVSATSPHAGATTRCIQGGPQIAQCETSSPISPGDSFTALFEIEAQAPGVLTHVVNSQVNMPFPGGGGASARGDSRTSVTVLPPTSIMQPTPRDPQSSAPAPQSSVASPVTQDSEQESEAGEIDQSFEVS